MLTTEQKLIFRDLANNYAAGFDRRDVGLVMGVFTPTGTIEVGGQVYDPQKFGTIVEQLNQAYVKTMHFVGNQYVELIDSGLRAKGETYCIAHHIKKEGDKLISLDWFIRYQDEYGKYSAEWRFHRRKLLIDWTRTYEVSEFQSLG